MTVQKRIANQRQRRQYRVRNKVRRSASGKPRLSVFRSNSHIYAQIIDDEAGQTLVAASTLEKEVRGDGKKKGSDKQAATQVGELIARRALEKGIAQVAFDRGLYRYHGRVAALAEAARQGGLEF